MHTRALRDNNGYPAPVEDVLGDICGNIRAGPGRKIKLVGSLTFGALPIPVVGRNVSICSDVKREIRQRLLTSP